VLAELEITDPSLVLPRPAVAQVGQASLLGGDAQVNLISNGKPLPPGTVGPHAKTCNNALVVCPGTAITGQATASLETVLGSMQRILDDAERQGLVTDLATTLKSFDKAAKEASALPLLRLRLLMTARWLSSSDEDFSAAAGRSSKGASSLPSIRLAKWTPADSTASRRAARAMTAALAEPPRSCGSPRAATAASTAEETSSCSV
jgi:hypothetical protein